MSSEPKRRASRTGLKSTEETSAVGEKVKEPEAGPYPGPASACLSSTRRGMGWLPDRPDFRDYNEAHEEIRTILDADKRGPFPHPAKTLAYVPPSQRIRASSLPASTDLRQYCSPVEDQGALGSCTAHAGVGLIEYYEGRAFGRHLDASRLFLYKVTRNLMKLRGDTGAYLRTTMGAMVLFGVPPESYWPYTDDSSSFDREPSAFCYAFAQNFQTIKYFRHDPAAPNPKTSSTA